MDIAILLPGLPVDGDAPENRSLGGSESAGVYMARELSNLGAHVTVFGNCDQAPAKGSGWYGKVHYRPQGDWPRHVEACPTDVTIVQRMPQLFGTRNMSRLGILWCHDLPIGRQGDDVRGATWNLDRIAVVSKFMLDRYKDVYNLPEEVLWQTRNGIDLSIMPEPVDDRDRFHLIFAARPERGLDILLDTIMPRLVAEDPRYHLTVYGYNNPVAHLDSFYNACAAKANALGPNHCQFGGHMSKPDLMRAYANAGLYIYPGPSRIAPRFAEVSCISLMEAQACGLPIVASNKGALNETLHAGAGVLVDGDPTSSEYADAFVRGVLAYRDPETYRDASRIGRDAAQSMSWRSVAQEWLTKFDELLAERNDDRTRLAYYFYKRSDIVAAKKVLAEPVLNTLAHPASRLRVKIAAEYAFAESPEALRDHYKNYGEYTTQRLVAQGADAFKSMFGETHPERRFLEIEAFVSKCSKDGDHILDFGCGHGWGTVYWANKLPGRRWVGCDIDPGALSWACLMRDTYAKDPANIRFVPRDDMNQAKAGDFTYGQYDVIVCSEVLEHSLDPKAELEEIERHARPGADIIITVPYGPSEFGTDNWTGFRNHIHELELDDIRDLLGHKRELRCGAVFDHKCEVTEDPVGYYLIHYKADGAPIGEINWERKLRKQAPRQTLSLAMMAGPGAEKTLRWCLEPWQYIADEIVVADTGLSDEARRIFSEYGARFVPSVDPKNPAYGFERPRNDALDACVMDWVVWIDTDERLCDPQNITKYLRKTMWDGFGFFQHHFAVDTHFPADMPVRLFRRTGNSTGKNPRFYGMIHEHPEAEMNTGIGRALVAGDMRIAHIGYIAESGRKLRFARNSPLMEADKAKYPDRKLQKHFMLRDNMIVVGSILAQTNNQRTPEVDRLCNETITIYREHFLAKKHFASSIDPVVYYTHALRVLGIGIDVELPDVRANREGVGDPVNGSSVRYASADEAATDIAARVKNKLERFDGLEF